MKGERHEHPADHVSLELGQLEAVTFDLWATVLGSPAKGGPERHRYRIDAMVDAYSQVGEPPDEARLNDVIKQDWKRFDQVWYGEHRTLTNRERLTWMTAELGYDPLPKSLADTVVKAFDESIWEGVPGIAPGVADLLSDLRAADIRLGVISDTSYSTGSTLKTLLSQEGLAEFIDAWAFSDEVGRSKPHPAMFEHALKALDAKPEATAHVGDNPKTDISGALDMGMHAVLYRPHKELTPDEPRPTAMVRHFDELRRAWFG